MSAWLRHHVQCFAQTLRGFGRNPVASLLNVLVIGFALALPLGAWTMLANLQVLLQEVRPRGEISVFLRENARAKEVDDARRGLSALQGVVTVQFVPKEQALAHLRRTAGVGDLVEALTRNPLPDAFVLVLASNEAALSERVVAAARALPAAAHVQADSAWARRLESVLALGRTVAVMLGAILGLALLAVTFNTIRLQIITRRDEIELCRLLGATDAYVRRPFFHLGVLQGLAGGLLAVGVVAAALAYLDREITLIALQYETRIQLDLLSWYELVLSLAVATGLSWMGTFASVSAHLRKIGQS